MDPHRHLVVFLLSLTLVGMELIWTRLFSAEFFYAFAFLTLSLAIMGLGLGALALRVLPALNRERSLGLFLCLTGLATLAGPPLVFRIGLKFSELFLSWSMLGRFVVAIGLLGAAFFFGGVCLALLFRRNHADLARLYMADLVGAGAGVLAAVVLMNGVGTPSATFLCSLPVLVAALLACRGWLRAVPVVLVACMVVLSVQAGPLLEQERPERGPVIYKHWDAVAKIKVYGFGEIYRAINIDNLANTGTFGFDGNWERPEEERFEFGIDVSNLVGRFESCTFLSLGAGGGMDVQQALQAGATEVHAVEVNAHINRMLLEGDPAGYIIPSPEPAWLAAQAKEAEEAERVEEEQEQAETQEEQGEQQEPVEQEEQVEPQGQAEQEEQAEQQGQGEEAEQSSGDGEAPSGQQAEEIITMAEFSGHFYSDPRVRVVTEDARAYVGRFENKFDLIYSLSSNTFAALASGSFALAENYLFTTEAFADYWKALSEDGFMMMEHQFYMPRLVASLLDALESVGVENPREHFAIYDLPQMRRNMILLSRRPLSDEIRNNAFGELTEDNYGQIHLLFPASEDLQDNLINRIVLEGWESVAADARVEVSPTVDDRPFVGQMGLWRNLSRENMESMRMMEIFGFPISKLLIVTILLVVVVFVVPLNLLPYLARGERLRFVPWLYFFVIGLAFMVVEVVLIQKYTLFVGPSAYSIATVLLTLLVASGLGSRFSARFGDRLPFLGIAVWLLLDILVFRHLFYALGDLYLGPRILVTAVLIAPLGFFMGMPFPRGASRVGELVDWGFAVNGAASVLGATAILLVAFALGFSAALLMGAALYLVALGLLSLGRAWTTGTTATTGTCTKEGFQGRDGAS